MKAKGQGQVHRLEELLVEEVSIVDKPANLRRFLTIKNEGSMQRQVQVDEQGNLTAVSEAPETTSASSAVSDAVDLGGAFAQAGEALTEVQKRLTIPSELRTEIFRQIGDSVRRLHTVMSAADVATTDEKGGSTLVPVLMSELQEVATSIGAAVKRLGKVSKADGYDSQGDTPTASDGALLDALDAATDAVSDAITKRNIGKGRLGKFKQAIGVLQSILSELEAPAKSASGGGDDAAAVAAAAATDTGKGAAPNVKKAGDSAKSVVEISKADFERMGGYIEKLVKTVEAQGKLINQLKSARPVSNALPVEKSSDSVSVSDTDWPSDMNADRSKGNVEKSISFHE